MMYNADMNNGYSGANPASGKWPDNAAVIRGNQASGDQLAKERQLASKRQAYQFGREAEATAAKWLESRGYEILSRNYRTRTSEADIIARKDGVIAIIEVKARSSGAYGLPREAVTWRKQTRIAQAAQSWLYEHNEWDSYVRFDVVEIYPGRIVHIRNAFEAPAEAA